MKRQKPTMQKPTKAEEKPAPSFEEELRASGGIQYCEAIRIALNNLEGALVTCDALGFLVSAKIRDGKIISVGVLPKGNG